MKKLKFFKFFILLKNCWLLSADVKQIKFIKNLLHKCDLIYSQTINS